MIFSTIIAFLSIFIFLYIFLNTLLKTKPENLLIGRKIFNPFNWNILIYIVTGLSGAFSLIFAKEQIYINEIIEFYSSPNLNIYVGIILLYGYITFILLIPYAYKLLDNSLYLSKRNNIKLDNNSLLYLSIFLIIIINVFIIQRAPYFFESFSQSNSFDILRIRKSLSNFEEVNFIVKAFLVDGFAWVLSLYNIQIKENRKIGYLMCFTLFIYFLFSLTKIKVITYLISICSIYVWNKRLKIKQIIIFGILLFLALIFMWSIYVKNLNLIYIFNLFGEGLFGRIFLSEISSLYAHLVLFGKYTSHIGISSLSNFLSYIMGIENSARSGRIVLEIVSPSWIEFGGVFNTVFFGEAFANFGIFGILLSPILVSGLYILINYLIRFLNYEIAIGFALVVGLSQLNLMSGINDFIWNPQIVMLFISCILLNFAIKK